MESRTAAMQVSLFGHSRRIEFRFNLHADKVRAMHNRHQMIEA